MARVIVIGYGNPLRGDDGFGWRAAEQLASLLADPEVDVRPVHQLTPELSEPLSEAEHAIFIDAAAEGEPGTILRRAVAPDAGAGSFTHQATPSGLLAMARALFGHAPEATLFSVPVQSVAVAESLSPIVEKALETVVGEIVELASFLSPRRSVW